VACDAVLAETCIFGNVDKFLPDYEALRPRKVMLHSRRLDNLIPNVTRCDLVRIFNREVLIHRDLPIRQEIPNIAPSHPRRLEALATPLREPQILHINVS